MITVLSGGVGAARLIATLSAATDAREITAVVNVGDDLVMHGLTICPDLDTIMYTLAGLNNNELGWGLEGESWRVMEELDALGGEAWFRLGDRDLATHLYRSQRLAAGATKTRVTRELCERLGVRVRLLPVTDDPLATHFHTELGRLSFQDYFVRHHHDVAVTAIDFEGANDAAATPEVIDALTHASRIVIAPSNPLFATYSSLGATTCSRCHRSSMDERSRVQPIDCWMNSDTSRHAWASSTSTRGSSAHGSSTRPTPRAPTRCGAVASTSSSRRRSWRNPRTPDD